MREKIPTPAASSSVCSNTQVQPRGPISSHQLCIVTAVHESTPHTYTRAFPSHTVPRVALTEGVSTPCPPAHSAHSQLCSTKPCLLQQTEAASLAAPQEAGGLEVPSPRPQLLAPGSWIPCRQPGRSTHDLHPHLQLCSIHGASGLLHPPPSSAHSGRGALGPVERTLLGILQTVPMVKVTKRPAFGHLNHGVCLRATVHMPCL